MATGALVLIDMQNDVLYSRPALQQQVEDSHVVQNCATAITKARQLDIPVVFVTVLRRASGSDAVDADTDLERKLRARGSGTPLTNVAGTPGSEIVPGLEKQPTDFVVVKRRRSGFVGTELDWILRRLGVERIILGGVATNWGVESTARDAYDLGYSLVVLSDCCCGFNAEDHDWAMTRVFPNMSLVRTVADFQAISDVAEF